MGLPGQGTGWVPGSQLQSLGRQGPSDMWAPEEKVGVLPAMGGHSCGQMAAPGHGTGGNAKGTRSLGLPRLAAVCSGDITDSAGVVLSPNWPEPYGRGQDCIWGVHVEEDKHIMLDVRV